MTDYVTHVEHYGPNGLVSSEDITVTLTGEEELAHLAPDKFRQAYSTLRQWASDADTTNTNWPSMSTAQKDAAMRETIRRLGILSDRLADLLLVTGRSV